MIAIAQILLVSTLALFYILAAADGSPRPAASTRQPE